MIIEMFGAPALFPWQLIGALWGEEGEGEMGGGGGVLVIFQRVGNQSLQLITASRPRLARACRGMGSATPCLAAPPLPARSHVPSKTRHWRTPLALLT